MLPSLRRSLLSLPSRAATGNVSLRSSSPVLRNTRRALATLSLPRSPALAHASFRPGTYSATVVQGRRDLQARWKSDDAGSFRKWGFEDITASLPTSPEAASPGTTPQKNLILVDVREPAELVSTGIIPSAVSVPLSSQPDALFLSPDEFETRFGYPKPGMEDGSKGDMVFYCRAGVRAKTAAALAVQAGYDPDRIGVYEGSWLDWAGRGGKAERWEEE
ncbi:Rhodanese-like domain-containing protein [Aspergillus sp. HF37]|nr:Rhodanese-like domain-containing protein [Aspergillus sp. HF37]